ncbi:hypothetical protein H4R18_004291 [Coemansia javaensis]|uniref:DUF7707 domain-containing protein n=1 Tax=Coemansia javaensis TaxID=2761396 RepID=A0A9W8H845_9FUNG|nr:hypothetical protein H4R18_004291 [Coemansia javaensis]
MLIKPCIALALAASALAAAPGDSAQQQQAVPRGAAVPSQSTGAPHAKSADAPHARGGPSSPRAAVAPPPAPAPTPERSPSKRSHRRRRTRRGSSSAFDPNDVDIGVKVTWCNDNTNFCQNVCLNKTWGAPINDQCDADSLSWHCTCGNGKNPDPDTYTFPVMLYECQYEIYQCQTNCATGDIRCTQECQGDRNCTAPNDPNNGKTAAPESDATDGLDGATATDPINFFSAASLLSAGGYTALAALVAASVHFAGLP